MIDEGYVKYKCLWDSRIFENVELKSLNKARNLMHKMGLIGQYEKLGIGFGNISCRNPLDSKQFIISGTNTGEIKKLGAEHYSLVTSCNIKENTVSCAGLVEASSESMTHSVIYGLSELNNAVIHVHNLSMWKRLQYLIPTTTITTSYGTPEMAEQVIDLYNSTELSEKRILAMAGHCEGIISFGETLEQASDTIIEYYKYC